MSVRSTFRVVSEEELLYESALRRRAQWRVFYACLLGLLGIAAILGSMYPLVLKSTIPLMWLDEANTSGWNAQLQTIGIHLLARGRIEAYPLWACVLASSMGWLLLWAGGTLFRLRNETKVWSSVMTKSFWTKAYVWHQPDDVISVTRPRRTKRRA